MSRQHFSFFCSSSQFFILYLFYFSCISVTGDGRSIQYVVYTVQYTVSSMLVFHSQHIQSLDQSNSPDSHHDKTIHLSTDLCFPLAQIKPKPSHNALHIQQKTNSITAVTFSVTFTVSLWVLHVKITDEVNKPGKWMDSQSYFWHMCSSEVLITGWNMKDVLSLIKRLLAYSLIIWQ